ncbi:MAG: amidohydrolase [Chloroflexi bacterium]|nr:amidohydrolase [Chloroflexota bacterium]
MIFDIRMRPAELQGKFPTELKDYRSKFSAAEKRVRQYQGHLDQWLKDMEDAGVTRGLVVPVPWVEDPNRRAAEFANKHPDKFIAAIELGGLRGMDALKEMEKCIKEYGSKCLCLRPFFDKMYVDDKSLFPLYAKCNELNITVSIVLGINYGTSPTLEYAQPVKLDNVASVFPELKIIVTHTGWPWAAETVAVALKNHNVYIDISGVGPRYIAMQGTGYEPLFHFGSTLLKDKMLWGTDWPLLDWKDSLAQMDELPLKPEVRRKWLYDNAIAALGLDA